MAARTAAHALGAWTALHQQVVACVTDGVLIARSGPEGVRVLVFATAPTAIGRWGDVLATVRVHFRIHAHGPRAWVVETVGYEYKFDDRDHHEIVAYHWHPTGISAVTFPHLHVDTRGSRFELSKAHFPTGRVTLAEVVRFAIADLGVEPLRPDWQTILDRADEAWTG